MTLPGRQVVSLAVLSVLPATGIAQDSLGGKYSASYSTTGINAIVVSVSINIEDVDNGVVKATGFRGDRSCRGDYPLEGTVKENQIRLRATKKGGPAGDCGFFINGTIEGNSIKAKWGQQDLEFRK